MKINDTGMKDVQRPTVTEKEIAKMKELSVAPVKSDTSDTQKVKALRFQFSAGHLQVAEWGCAPHCR